jgi:hypothetical protein
MAKHWLNRPKNVLGIVLLAIPILATFAACVLLLAFLLAYYLNTSTLDGGTLTLACLCALVIGLFLIVFHVNHETVLMPCKDRAAFLANCRSVLKDLGYDVHDQSPEELVSRPAFWAMLVGGRIYVDAVGNDMRIAGPKVFVEIVRRRLRLQSLVANVEQSLRDGRLRHGDRLLKRVQISLRVTPEHWSGVGHHVVEQLAAAGAELYCEVHVLAQSSEGIRESFVEGPLRDWLRQENIPTELHKDHVRWDEPPGATAAPAGVGAVVGNMDSTQVEDHHCGR